MFKLLSCNVKTHSQEKEEEKEKEEEEEEAIIFTLTWF
jgi:hypothetical protein